MQPALGAQRLGRVRRTRIVASLMMVVLGASACDVIMPTVEPDPIWGTDPVRVETVTLADDRRSVRLEFTGAAEFDPNNPCSLAYEGSAQIEGDVLQVAVLPQPHPMPLAEGTGCDAIGYARHLDIALDEPFAGNRVHDLAGYDLLLEAQ